MSQIDIWSYISVIPTKEILILLKAIRDNPNDNKTELQKKAEFSGGKFYQTFKSAYNMNLISNGGYAIKITDLGKEWLSFYDKNMPLPIEITRKACLNVPLFKEYYEKNPLTKDQDEVRKYFTIKIKELKPAFRDTLIGSAVRQYLYGVYGIHFNRYKFSNKTKSNVSDKSQQIKITREQIYSVLTEEQKKKLVMTGLERANIVLAMNEKS